jgi:hypothetical protein
MKNAIGDCALNQVPFAAATTSVTPSIHAPHRIYPEQNENSPPYRASNGMESNGE